MPFIFRHADFNSLPRLLLLAMFLLTACSEGVHWDKRERENAVHLLAALKFTSEAAGIANDIHSDSDYEEQHAALLQALRAAHWNAVQVDDHVLDKLHPQLYARFRLGFQRALGRMVRAYEENDVEAAQRAATDVRDFMDWYRSENHNFRWWEEAAPR